MKSLLALIFPLAVISLLAISLRTSAYGQSPPAAQGPQISFTFDFPGSSPDHYSLTVDSSGHSIYTSGKPDSKASSDADSDSSPPSEAPSKYEFTLSDTMRARIFDLAKRADYFKGDLDFGKGRLANTGSKTLTYKDGTRITQATYNYSNKPVVQELTRILQAISATLEFGLRLDYLHRYQKLALEDQLKQMEAMARSGQLEELAAVAPVLKRIADDGTVMNVSRARAERLLAAAKANSTAK